MVSHKAVSSIEGRFDFLTALGLHKGTQPRDRFAENEVLHLIRPFITKKRFGVREESPDVVIDRKTVAAKYLTAPRHSLATLGRGKRLGERCLSVSQLALVVQLSCASHQTLTGCEVS